VSRAFVSSSARIAAPAARVYGIIADYRKGHPRIVPPRWFGPIEVERGGVGAGTVIRFTMTLLGKTTTLRAEVAEPEPGRLLTERYAGSDTTTSFRVEAEPPSGGADESAAAACIVTIATDFPRKPGLLGRLEAFLGCRHLRRVYREELELLRSAASAAAAASL
jgi:polyketide cyclase/dehydrase/lipid transport protein